MARTAILTTCTPTAHAGLTIDLVAEATGGAARTVAVLPGFTTPGGADVPTKVLRLGPYDYVSLAGLTETEADDTRWAVWCECP